MCVCVIVLIAAMVNLDKLKLWGKNIKVTPSKHNIVQMPKDGQSVRFRLSVTKNYTNICIILQNFYTIRNSFIIYKVKNSVFIVPNTFEDPSDINVGYVIIKVFSHFFSGVLNINCYSCDCFLFSFSFTN